MKTTAQNLQPVLSGGSAGDSPAPVGDSPTGTANCFVAFRSLHGLGACARSVRRAACATRTNAGFHLQSAPALTGPFTNILGATSPYTNITTSAQQFFRLKGD